MLPEIFWAVFEFGWILIDLVFSLLVELGAREGERRRPKAESPHEEFLWAGAVALALGFLLGCVLPDRLLPPGPFPGISLIIVPGAVGLMMHLLASYRRRRQLRTSRLASWLGGGVLGFGLAAGRLLGMWFFRVAA